MIKKNWSEFRKTGLLLFINQLLHIFGWAIVVECDKDTKEVTGCYPARVKFRGFDKDSTDDAYKKLSQYMMNNAGELNKEVNE